MKQLCSVLLILVLILGLLPTAAFAEERADKPFTRSSFCQALVDGLDLRYDESMAVDFDDLPTTHPNYQAVAIMVHMGVTTGVTATRFNPEGSITRAQAATFLYRLGLPVSALAVIPSDVSAGTFYYEAVESVLETGIMRTDIDGLFHPNNPVYPGDIDMKLLYSILSSINMTDPVQLDLSQGSITISKNVFGITVITQGTKSFRTNDTSLLIRQSSSTTSNTISVKSGDITITLAGVNIEKADSNSIYTDTSLTLNLIGENAVSGSIRVSKNAALTIQGTGALTARDGISSSGAITINSGTITASTAISGGTITINGGNITAHGNYYAVGGDSLTIGENAALTLSHERPDGYDLYENISDLELPASAVSRADNSLGLSVEARSHSGIVSYQWQTCASNSSRERDWTDIESQTAAVCTAAITPEQDGHYFRCKITNVYGNVAYTDAAQGFVLAFRQQPQSVETDLNQTAAFSVTCTCPNVTYRWQRSYDEGTTWSDVPGETYSTLLVSTTRSENGALYRCVITAANGDELASDSARITVDTGEQTYTIRYYQENADGSGYTLVSQDVLSGEAGQSVTAPEKAFDGFTENASKGTIRGTVTASGLILSRYFDRNPYQITFHTNGGSALPPLSAKYGAPIRTPDAPNRYGYVFSGWYADAALSQVYEFTTMPLNGTAVYAKWTPKGQDRGIEYQIKELAFRDANTYETLSGIPSKDFLAEVTVTNLSSTETDTVLLITYDKNGKMLGMSYLYANPQIGQTITLGTRIQNSNRQAGKVKALVLPDLASPIPLANTVEKS